MAVRVYKSDNKSEQIGQTYFDKNETKSDLVVRKKSWRCPVVLGAERGKLRED